MDVQTLAPGAAQHLPPDPAVGDSSGGNAVAPTTQALSIPQTNAAPAPVPGSDSSAPHTLQLPQEVAKIFTGGAAQQVTVSFQVAHNPNEIVTVFKNSQTGEIISQVPSEIMIKIAEFFDQVAGIVLDKSA